MRKLFASLILLLFAASLVHAGVFILASPPPVPGGGGGGGGYTFASTTYTCSTNIYIESPANGGSDSNNGLTPATPIATLIRFNAMSPSPGTCGLLGPGTFAGFTASASGNADTATGYIVLKSRLGPGQAFITKQVAGGFNTVDLAQNPVNYWIFDGLDITGPVQDSSGGGNAIEFEGTVGTPSHHFKIFNSTVHDASSACIAVLVADYYYIYNNKTFNCAWTNTSSTSCIDIAFLQNFNSAAGFHGIVSRNFMAQCAVGPGVTSSALHTDGNCFIADTFTQNGYTAATLVDDNVAIHCGGRGFHTYKSNLVTYLNNTSLYNQTDLRVNGTNNGDVDAYQSNNITWCNNLVVSDSSYNSANFAIVDDGGGGTNSGNTYFNNLTFNGTAGQSAVRTANTSASIVNGVNGNQLGVDPLIAIPTVDQTFADYHVQPGSPALGAGTTSCGVASPLDYYGNTRPTGGGITIGAAQGSVASTWVRSGVTDEMLFSEGLFTTGSGTTGQTLLTNTQAGTNMTDLLPSSPPGYPYMQYGANKIRLAYGGVPGSLRGLLNEGAATNYLLNSAAPVTQTTGALGAGTYDLWINGAPVGGLATAGHAVLSNGTATGCSGDAIHGAPVTFTVTAGTCTVTVSGKVYFFQLEAHTTGTVQGVAGSSGIVTAGATGTRSPDYYLLAGNALNTSKAATATVFFNGAGSNNSGNFFPKMVTSNLSTTMIRGLDSTDIYTLAADTTQLNNPIGSGTVFGPMRVVLAWDGTGRSYVGNGGAVATDSHSFGGATTIALGSDSASGNNNYGGLILEYSDYNNRQSNANICTLTGGSSCPVTGAGGGSPPPAGTFDFTLNFSAVAAGTAFLTTTGVQQSVINDQGVVTQWNNDPDGSSATSHMWFVANGTDCGTGHSNKVLETYLPAGDLGQNVQVAGYGYNNQLIIKLKDTDVLNLSYDMCLGTNYYLGSLSKLVMHLSYGDLSDFSGQGRSTLDLGNECSPLPPPAYTTQTGGCYSTRKFWADYSIRGGNGEITTPDWGTPQVNTWYHIQMQLKRGASGNVKVIMDGVTRFNAAVTNICDGANPGCTTCSGGTGCSTSVVSPPIVEMSTWFGGGSSVYSPGLPAIVYYDNIRIWSGTGP